MCLCVRINLRVVSDPLRASLASFAYTANTASWYSVRELRCSNTTEVSLPSTTAWSPGARVVDEEEGARKMDVKKTERWGTEMDGRRGKEEEGGNGERGNKWGKEMKMINGREERKRRAGQEREIEREWQRMGKTIDLLNGIKHKAKKYFLSF